MRPLSVIQHYYQEGTPLYDVLVRHSRSVADFAIDILRRHPELNADSTFVEEAAMLHDIGICRTQAPGIFCTGDKPYICHGTIGADMMRQEGFPRHALVCERHTGAGLSLQQIIEQRLPVPHRDLLPVSIEEQVICFADKFFSKTKLDRQKTPEEALRSLEKFGEEGTRRFRRWMALFL